MRILGKSWADGYLDHWRAPGQCRLKVLVWHNLAPIEDAYITYSKDWRLVLNYLFEIGPSATLRKIASRSRELIRNCKYISCGIGEVIECDNTSSFSVGDQIVFLAPFHPRCMERVVLPEVFLQKVTRPLLATGLRDKNIILYYESGRSVLDRRVWEDFAGWSDYAGWPVDVSRLSDVLAKIEEYLLSLISVTKPIVLSVAYQSPVEERYKKEIPKPRKKALKAVLFGYGHYARTMIIPNLSKKFLLACVHEIDPTQLGRIQALPFSCDSSPYPRTDERYDVYLISGYHHTHAPIAVHALKQGAYAVVEKPLVTTFAQLEELVRAVHETPGRFFGCFQKRYSPSNELAKEDLGVNQGDPINYHCIVFEVPLPRLHWYNWPNSGSRIISNGCHWIDHFLYLNDFCPVRDCDVWEANNGDIIVTIELMNGACFSMALTDHGSARIGVQEYVELRTGGTTVIIKNDSNYLAEDSRRIKRRASINKLSPHNRMYNHIFERIYRGEPGDSVESIERSSKLVLELEEKLRWKRSKVRN